MVLGYIHPSERIDWFLGYLVKLVVRPWNCFNRFVYILFWPSLCQRPPPSNHAFPDVKMDPTIGRGNSLLGKPSIFQVPVTFCRSISGFMNGWTIPRLFLYVRATACVRSVRNLRHVHILKFFSFGPLALLFKIFFFFRDLFLVSFDISRLKPNSLWSCLFLLVHKSLMKPPSFL